MDHNVVETALVEPGREGAINAATRRKLPCVVNATADSLGFLNGKIPAIGLFDVLEHIEDDVNFLSSLRKMLMDVGKVYLTVPAYRFLWSATDIHAGHFRRYSKTMLNSVIEKAGFKILYCSGIFTALIPLVFLLRSLKTIWGVRKSIDLSHKNNVREHGAENSLAWRIVERFIKNEIEMILRRRKRLGASLICVAELK